MGGRDKRAAVIVVVEIFGNGIYLGSQMIMYFTLRDSTDKMNFEHHQHVSFHVP